MPVGPSEPATKRAPAAACKTVGRGASDFGGAAIDLRDPVANSVLVQLQARRGERVRFDGVRPGLEIGKVDTFYDVRARKDQRLVAPMEARAAKISIGEVERHKLGAHSAIENKDAFGQSLEIGLHLHSLFPTRPDVRPLKCPDYLKYPGRGQLPADNAPSIG